jgi:hypothetical protein
MSRLKEFFKNGDDTSIAERELLIKTHDEIKELYKEVNKQHLENAKMLLEVQKSVDLAKSDITETAINKALGILLHVRHWMLAILFVIAIAGFLGYQSFSSSLNAYFKERVEEWLRFDTRDSEGRAALEELRTQALLDAYTIRLSRSFSNPFGINSISLEESEIKRLVEIIVDVDTNYSDFTDALRLVTKSRGVFVLMRPEDEVGRQLTSILGSKSYSNNKKILILEYLSKDEALLPSALSMLESDDTHESIKLRVLNTVAYFQPDLAIDFANSNIDTMESLYSKSKLASFLAEYDPTSPKIYNFLRYLRNDRPDKWENHYAGPLSALLDSKKARAHTIMRETVTNALTLGFTTLISDMRAGPRYLAVSFGNTISDIEDPKELLSDTDFVTDIISASSHSLESFTKALNFFQIEDGEHILTSVLISLSQKATLRLKNKLSLTSRDVNGKVWLRAVQKAGVTLIDVTWRDNVGEVKSSQLASFDGLAESHYEISFDSKVVENMSIREYNRDFHAW